MKKQVTYEVFWVGGKRDGEVLKTFDDEWDAIQFARAFMEDHEEEFEPCYGGVSINASDGHEVIDW